METALNRNDIAKQASHDYHLAHHHLVREIASWLRDIDPSRVLDGVAVIGGVAVVAGAAVWMVGNTVQSSLVGATLESVEQWVNSLPDNVGSYSDVGHRRSHQYLISINYLEAFHHFKDLPIYARAQVAGAVSILAGGLTGLLACIGSDIAGDNIERSRSG